MLQVVPHKYNMLLLQIPSTGLEHSVYVLPNRLTGCWLEATPQDFSHVIRKLSLLLYNAHRLPREWLS